MSDIERRAVKIRHDDQVREGTLAIRVYTSGERVRRGLAGRAWRAFWGPGRWPG